MSFINFIKIYIVNICLYNNTHLVEFESRGSRVTNYLINF